MRFHYNGATPESSITAQPLPPLRYELKKLHFGTVVEYSGSTDEQKPVKEETVEAWVHSTKNSVVGWYGL